MSFGRGYRGGRSRGGRFGGRGAGRFNNNDPPDSVIEVGTFEHPCEGEAVCKLTIEKVLCPLSPPKQHSPDPLFQRFHIQGEQSPNRKSGGNLWTHEITCKPSSLIGRFISLFSVVHDQTQRRHCGHFLYQWREILH